MQYRFRVKLDQNGEAAPGTLQEAAVSTLIGRREPATLILPLPEVSSRHALLRYDPAGQTFLIEDLGSKQGTFLNGNQLPPNQAKPIVSGGIVQIGRALLMFEVFGAEARTPVAGGETATGGGGGRKKTAAADAADAEKTHLIPFPEPPEGPAEPAVPGAPVAAAEHGAPRPGVYEAQDKARSLTNEVQKILLARVDLAQIVRQAADDQQARHIVRTQIGYVVHEFWKKGRIREDEIAKLEKDSYDDILGFGPLQDLMDDPTVSEIMVNRPDQIYFERSGKIFLCQRSFQNDQHVQQVLRRFLRDSSRRIDEANPIVNATIQGGCRMNAVLPPIALAGTTITIRKFHHSLNVDSLVERGTMSRGIAAFLALTVRERQNIIVSGGTGSGKTTLLNVLSTFIPEDQRIVTVEDTAELCLVQPHVVRLQARPANTEGTGLITIQNLVIESLRMRPDRVIVGECRSSEALDMLQAMNTGHDGSMTTVHANSAHDAFYRLETMVLLSGLDLPLRAIREQIRSAVNFIVHEQRMVDGTRKITEILELTALEGEEIVTQPVYRFIQDKLDEEGRVIGRHEPTGYIPRFLNRIRQQGKSIDPMLFNPS